jgi:hypothetical protein
MQVDNTLIIIVIVFALVILAVIIAYRRRIKTGVKALGTEFSIEAEGRAEPASSIPPTGAPAGPATGERSVTTGSANGATIVTGEIPF